MIINVEPDIISNKKSFAFDLFEYLIQVSNNIFHSSSDGFAWI